MGLSSFCWLALKVNGVICASVFAIKSNSESGLSVEDFLCALPYCGFSLLNFYPILCRTCVNVSVLLRTDVRVVR